MICDVSINFKISLRGGQGKEWWAHSIQRDVIVIFPDHVQ